MLFKRIIIILFLFIPVISYANSAAVTQLEHYLQNTQTMQAHFKQIVSDSGGTVMQKVQGEIFLQKPGKFRWQTVGMNRQLIIINLQRVWIYNIDLKQVTTRPLQKNNDTTPAALLSGKTSDFAKHFIVKVKQAGNKDRLVWFDLQPKKHNAMVSNMRIGFQQGEIKKLVFQDRLQQTTTITFFNIKLNQPINEKQFIFHMPKGVDVLREK